MQNPGNYLHNVLNYKAVALTTLFQHTSQTLAKAGKADDLQSPP